MGGALLVDGIFDREGIAHVHLHFFVVWVSSIFLGDGLVWTLHHILVSEICWYGRVAITTHQRESAVDAKDVLASTSHHPFLTA